METLLTDRSGCHLNLDMVAIRESEGQRSSGLEEAGGVDHSSLEGQWH